MGKLLLGTAGLAVILAAPSAQADNISLFMSNGTATETASGTGSASLAMSNLGGVQFRSGPQREAKTPTG